MEDKSLERLIIDLKESLEREIGGLRRDVHHEIGELRHEVREIRERLDRVEGRLTVISFDIAGIHRSIDEGGRRELEARGAREGQQRVIDDLAARVTRLEQRLEGKQ